MSSVFDGFKIMPKGVGALYTIQALSTFAFAIFFSSLSLYLTKELGFSQILSNNIVGIFLAFNFTLHLFGGLMGGTLLTNRLLFVLTVSLQFIGLFVLSISGSHNLYLGLGIFLVGSGLNTTCYNNLLSQMFSKNDKRRDTAFFISYGAMNLGFSLGYIVSGFFDGASRYTGLFEIGALSCIITLAVFFRWKNHYKDTGSKLSKIISKTKRINLAALGTFIIILLIPVSVCIFSMASLSNDLISIASIVMLCIILYLLYVEKNKIDKGRIKAYLLLALSSVLFWMIYYTGPMGVTLFIENNVNKHFLGFNIATQWIFNINALIIVCGAPLIDFFVKKLEFRGVDLSTSKMFAWGFFFLALSFISLSLGIFLSNVSGYSSLFWTVIHFIFQGISELLIAPVGLALVGRISPTNLSGILMGTWMMVSGVSASLSHYFSNAMVIKGSTVLSVTNVSYYQVFNALSLAALVAALTLLFLSSFITRCISGTEKIKETSLNDEQMNKEITI